MKSAPGLAANISRVRFARIQMHRNLVDWTKWFEVGPKRQICHRERLSRNRRETGCSAFGLSTICTNFRLLPLPVAIGKVTVPYLGLSLAERTFPPLILPWKHRFLGCGRGQIYGGNVNLVVSRRAIALPTIYDPFRHSYYRPRENRNQRRCSAHFHRPRTIDCCRRFRRSILRAFPTLHTFADFRTYFLDAPPLCR